MTRWPLANMDLRPVYPLRDAIREWASCHGVALEEPEAGPAGATFGTPQLAEGPAQQDSILDRIFFPQESSPEWLALQAGGQLYSGSPAEKVWWILHRVARKGVLLLFPLLQMWVVRCCNSFAPLFVDVLSQEASCLQLLTMLRTGEGEVCFDGNVGFDASCAKKVRGNALHHLYHPKTLGVALQALQAGSRQGTP